MGKKSTTQKTPERAFVTVKMKDRATAVPDVKDGKVGDLTVAEYLDGLSEGALVEQVISIARKFGDFKDFFATHVEWIHELRCRIPSRGTACKINLVDSKGNEKLLTWSQFCLEIFGVSARWVAKLMANYLGMVAQPDIDEPEVETDGDGEQEKKESPLAETRRHLDRAEDELETVRTQTTNLRFELGNLLGKIDDLKRGKISKEDLYKFADACKFRVVPPAKVGDQMDTEGLLEPIGTEELLAQLNEVTGNGSDAEAND